jgi:hypothetical protein
MHLKASGLHFRAVLGFFRVQSSVVFGLSWRPPKAYTTHPCRARRWFWREIHMSVSAVGPLRQCPTSQWRPPNPSSLRRLLPHFSPPPFPLHAFTSFTSATDGSSSAAARRSRRRERTQCRPNRTAWKVRVPSAQSRLLIRSPPPPARAIPPIVWSVLSVILFPDSLHSVSYAGIVLTFVNEVTAPLR